MRYINDIFISICVLGLMCLILNSPLTKATNFEKIADVAGFTYDANQDIYVTKVQPLQRYFGYSGMYDNLASTVSMVIDSEPILFNYKGKEYMIELWKGQYGPMTGSEIGIYERYGSVWKCVGDQDMLYMSYSLVKNGIKIFDREGTHWWLTGFKLGVFSNPEELTLENIVIKFKDVDMLNAFVDGLYRVGYSDEFDQIKIDLSSNSVSFRFSNTKTVQPSVLYYTKNIIQSSNKEMVRRYNLTKASIGKSDNSPATIDLMLNKVPLLNYSLDFLVWFLKKLPI
ncbi:MAG: DUF4474 domain-containing protein [Oligoflexia bacterium]|nr:DUF4474 domain-containing protein [Oligoflexia bacterium]